MIRSDVERLRDAQRFPRYAQGNAGGLTADVLADSLQPQHAALFDLVVVGEALNKVSAAVKSAAPGLPWKAIVNLRNIVVHSYWQIDLEIIADVIETELDPLIHDLEGVIQLIERADS